MIHHPLADPVVWARTLLSTAAAAGLPGWWILGRFVRASWPARAVLSFAAGMLGLAVCAQLCGHLGLPLVPWTWPLVAATLGCGLGFWPAYRGALGALLPADADSGRGPWLVAGLACCAMAAVLIALQADLPVAPSRHDTGNHAFMTWRILETGHTDPDVVFAPPWGHPPRPYFTGWHAAAALVARWGGLPAHEAVWLLPTVAAALLPLAALLLWRVLGFPGRVAAAAAWLLPVAPDLVMEIPGHGGLGQFVAMTVLVLPVLLLLRSLRDGTRTAAALAGVALAGLLFVHASWTVHALLLVLVGLWRAGGVAAGVGRRVWFAAGTALVAFFAVTAWDLVPAMGVYRERGLNPDALLPLVTCLRMVLRSAGGWWGLEAVVAAALAIGLIRPGTRPVALLALALGTLSVALGTWQDPVSMLLSQPWYQVHSRFFPPLALLLAPLVASLVWLLVDVTERRTPGRGPAAAALLILVLAVPAGLDLQGPSAAGHVYFTDDDAALARRIPEVVPEDGVVANWRNNGSCWAMQLSGRRFLMGANWILGEAEGFDHREAVKGLARGWWNPAVRGLRELGVTHLHATDHWPFDRQPVLQRQALKRRPYLTPVLQGEHTTIFAVDWEKFSRPRGRGGRR